MEEKDWRLKLRYGLLTTPFKHYTLIADGIIEREIEDPKSRKGHAYMAINIWANAEEDATDILLHIGSELGFKVTGHIEIYESEPKESPSENQSCYGVNFHTYE